MFDNHLDGESGKRGLIHVFIKVSLVYVCIADLSVGWHKYVLKRRSFERKSVSYPSILTCVLVLKRTMHIKTVLLSIHNIYYGWEIRKGIFIYALLTGDLSCRFWFFSLRDKSLYVFLECDTPLSYSICFSQNHLSSLTNQENISICSWKMPRSTKPNQKHMGVLYKIIMKNGNKSAG